MNNFRLRDCTIFCNGHEYKILPKTICQGQSYDVTYWIKFYNHSPAKFIYYDKISKNIGYNHIELSQFCYKIQWKRVAILDLKTSLRCNFSTWFGLPMVLSLSTFSRSSSGRTSSLTSPRPWTRCQSLKNFFSSSSLTELNKLMQSVS